MPLPENGGLGGYRRLRVRDVVHREIGHHRRQGDPGHPDKGGVLHPDFGLHAALRDDLGLAAEYAQHADRDDDGAEELHYRDAQIAQAGIDAQCGTFAVIGKEIADVGHARAEIASPQAAKQGQDQHGRIGRGRILHGDADADRGDEQAGGGNRRPAPSAYQWHHERIENPQCGAG
ncbi:hypothetical protein D9M68_748530 [compost metagenome]